MLFSADPAETLRPQAEAAGADLSKLVLLEDPIWGPKLADELDDL